MAVFGSTKPLVGYWTGYWTMVNINRGKSKINRG